MTASVYTEAGRQKGVCSLPASVRNFPLFIYLLSPAWGYACTAFSVTHLPTPVKNKLEETFCFLYVDKGRPWAAPSAVGTYLRAEPHTSRWLLGIARHAAN